jgi:hypothetical protein
MISKSKSLVPWRSLSSLLTSAPAKDPLFVGGVDVTSVTFVSRSPKRNIFC